MFRTLFARIFFLVAVLILLSTASWLTLFRFVDAEPRARDAAELTTSAVNLIRASLFAASPDRLPGLFLEFSAREEIRLRPAEPEDELEPLPDGRFYRLLEKELTARLGQQTRIASSVNGISGFWVSFRLDDADEEEYWLVLPLERATRRFASQWFMWAVLASALAMGIAWLIASHISRPLRAFARSAKAVGRGLRPEPLPETGTEEIRRLSMAFNSMASALEQHEKDRSEVLAGISHDLRTPLTRLRLEAEMSVADDEARQGIITDIEQMEAVISQFMDYARTEGGEAAEPTDLAALLANIVARQSRRAGGDTNLLSNIADLPVVNLRPKAITRAVDNLIDNAFKYGAPPVRLTASCIGRVIRIDVADRGEGIPEEARERLKRPFTRHDSARSNVTGTGLGLAIVERIARLHDGQLELLPNPGGGLLARLTLPLGD